MMSNTFTRFDEMITSMAYERVTFPSGQRSGFFSFLFKYTHDARVGS